MADKKTCFVIGPIGEEGSPERIHADWLYKGIVIRLFEKHFPEWLVERADKITTPGMISSQIINRLHDADLVIADLSFHNANAFYELSIRHTVGKPIVHMIRKGEKIPFDVALHRAIPFSCSHPDDLDAAVSQLKDSVADAIKPDFTPDNPITHARGKLVFEEHATPAMKVMSDEIQALRARIDSIGVQPTSFVNDRKTETLLVRTSVANTEEQEELFRKIKALAPGQVSFSDITSSAFEIKLDRGLRTPVIRSLKELPWVTEVALVR